MSPSTRVSVADFWEYAGFVVNSVIFLLIGLEVKAGHFADYAPAVAAAIAVTFLGRLTAVLLSASVIGLTSERLERNWRTVLVWGGLRGSLSMALALSLPADFPGRQLILTLVFGVVAFSLLVQGLTMKPLLRFLGLVTLDRPQKEYELRRGELLAKEGALRELTDLEERGFVSHETVQHLRSRLDEEIAFLRTEVSHFFKNEENIRGQEESVARRRMLDAEKQAVKEACRDNVISEETMKELVLAIDEEIESPKETPAV